MKDYAAIANEYARAIVTGEIPANRAVRLSCQRHLDDLAKSESDPEYPYKFSPKRAAKVCSFGEMLPLGGRFGGRGRKLKLQPWQVFLIACTFGWLRRKDNLRRFRTVYLYVPRKNGKSFLSAFVGLYMLRFDGEQQAEVYCGATTHPQAQYVFQPAKSIVNKTPALKQSGIQVLANSLYVPATESRMTAVIGQPPDGSSPSCALLDEAHEWPNDILLTTMTTGMGARLQPLVWVTTTAGYNTAGPAKLMQDDLIDVLEGVKQDDQLFGLIYGLDPGDDWKSDASLFKANPNIDVSVGLEYLRSQIAKAIQTARLRTPMLTKHLNVWCQAAIGWIDMERWHRCADRTLKLEDFKGEPCWAGIDLAEIWDFTAYVLLFRRIIEGKEHYYCFPRFYLPAARIDDPTNAHYAQWFDQGYLEAVPGEVNSHLELADQITADAKQFTITELAFDEHMAHKFMGQLIEAGHTCVGVPQKWQFQSEPLKALEALVMDGRLHHNGHPIMTWCIANTCISPLANDVIVPRRPSDHTKKIDGTIALQMAIGRAIITPTTDAWAFLPFVA